MFLQEPTAVDHREDFYRTERDICMYDMMREKEDADFDRNN